MGLFKKKIVKEKITERKTNSAGERIDRLDKDGNLPFGWSVYNKKYVDMIESELKPFRMAVSNAKTDIERWEALKSFLLHLKDGKKHYAKYGECVSKYFEEYVCGSYEAIQKKKDFDTLGKKLKKDSHI